MAEVFEAAWFFLPDIPPYAMCDDLRVLRLGASAHPAPGCGHVRCWSTTTLTWVPQRRRLAGGGVGGPGPVQPPEPVGALLADARGYRRLAPTGAQAAPAGPQVTPAHPGEHVDRGRRPLPGVAGAQLGTSSTAGSTERSRPSPTSRLQPHRDGLHRVEFRSPPRARDRTVRPEPPGYMVAVERARTTRSPRTRCACCRRPGRDWRRGLQQRRPVFHEWSSRRPRRSAHGRARGRATADSEQSVVADLRRVQAEVGFGRCENVVQGEVVDHASASRRSRPSGFLDDLAPGSVAARGSTVEVASTAREHRRRAWRFASRSAAGAQLAVCSSDSRRVARGDDTSVVSHSASVVWRR